MRGGYNRKPVIIRGERFASCSEAATRFGLTGAAVSLASRRGTLDNVGVGTGHSECNARPVEIDGVQYPTIKAAKDATGMTRHKLTLIAETQE